jgi:hypothetical protein
MPNKINLKYVYVPIIKDSLKIGNDTYDCMLDDLDLIPFYDVQHYNNQERLQIANTLTMYQIAEHFFSELELGIESSEIQEKIQDDLNGNSLFEKNGVLQSLKEWYKEQKIEFIVLDVEKEEKFKIWEINLNSDFNNVFTSIDKLPKDGDYSMSLERLQPILNPNKQYGYIEPKDIIDINGIERTREFEVVSSEAIESKFILWYLVEELGILEKEEEFGSLNYNPEELEVEFKLDGESISQIWSPYRGWNSPDNYAINIKYKYDELVDSGEDDDQYEETEALYETIIQDYMNLLENDYDFSLLVLGRSGGYFGFEVGIEIFEAIKIILNKEVLEVVLSDYGPFSIQNFYDNVIEETEACLEEVEEISDGDFDIVNVEYTEDFINFNKDVYTYIKHLSSGPRLKSYDEYIAWEEGTLEEYRQRKIEEI